jgi:squalene-hopene/tetraprenyl-beta-curcumene cyclase
MGYRFRLQQARVNTLPGVLLAVALLGGAPIALAGEPAPSAATLANSDAEPFAPVVSMARAAAFLDEASLTWTRQRRCGTCHTNYPYLVARPHLPQFASPVMAEVRGFFEQRVSHWDDDARDAKPRWDAEVIATAAALALNDAATTGTLDPLTRKALDRIWTLQKPDGGFEWLKCDWPPLESDDYYGAIVAAIATGQAPGRYAEQPSARAGLTRLRRFFAENPPPIRHHGAMLLWAGARLDGLLTGPRQAAIIAGLRDLQRPDGGWNLPSLGPWKRRDGSPNDPRAPSDGYATGLVVFVLRQAGVPAADPALRRGLAWLRSNQRASGRWFTRSVNNDKFHYITHAGTAYAVLAIHACDPAASAPAPGSPARPRAIPPAAVSVSGTGTTAVHGLGLD